MVGPAASESPEPETRSDSRSETAKTVLVIDDNALVRRLFVSFLTEMNVVAIEAETPSAAVDLALDYRPDLILMDIVMPDTNGLELLDRVRATPEIASTPVIAVSTLAHGPERVNLDGRGFDEIVGKPVQVEEFVAAVRRQLQG